jgi:hypothetical protein
LKSKNIKKKYKIIDIDENENESDNSLLKNKTIDTENIAAIKEKEKKSVIIEKSVLFIINFLVTFFLEGILSGLQSVNKIYYILNY